MQRKYWGCESHGASIRFARNLTSDGLGQIFSDRRHRMCLKGRMELANRTILIVDDNPDDRFFMSKALAHVAPGIVAEYVGSGDEAVAYLKGQGVYSDRGQFPFPSFVITDLEMDNGDGFSVLRELQQTRLTQVLRVMMLSSSENPEHVRCAYQLGATSYCPKPVGYARLCAILTVFFNDVPDKASAPERDGRLVSF